MVEAAIRAGGSIMSPLTTLQRRLKQAGIEVDASLYSKAAEAPWFVRALQAFSGWLAALFLLGFIALGAVFIVESILASLGVGGMMLGVAYVLLRSARGELLEHLALAISLAGQMLVAWALIEAWEDTAYLWWALLGLQCVLALMMPSLVHRGFSAFAASVALYMALTTSAMEPVASGALVLMLTVLWLNEFRWPHRIYAMQAWGTGLVLGLLLVQGLEQGGQSLTLWFSVYNMHTFVGLVPWLNGLAVALSLALLLYRILPKLHWLLYLSPIGLLLVSILAPGVGQGVVIVLLGFAVGHRLVMGLGVVSLLMGIGSYYYWLDATLFTKALTLLMLGGVLLGLRWVLRKRLGVLGSGPSISEGGLGK